MTIKKSIFSAFIVVLFCVFIGNSQQIIVPINVQYSLFLKILTFNRNLKLVPGDSLTIGIIYQTRYRLSLETKKEFEQAMNKLTVEEFNEIKIKNVAINIENHLEAESFFTKNKINLIYVAPLRAYDVTKISNLSKKLKILTLTGVNEYIDFGLSITIGVKGDKPQIIINLPSAKAEGADFSSQLLKLATVIE